MIKWKRMVVAAFATSAVSVAGGVALGVADDPSDAQRAKQFAAADLARGGASPASIASTLSSYAVLERPSGDADRIPTQAIGAEAQARSADRSKARRVFDQNGAAVFAVPVSDGVCLRGTTAAVNACLPDVVLPDSSGDDALRGAQAVLCAPTLPRDTLVLYGMIPDGVQNLSAKLSDGTVRPLDVGENFFYGSFSTAAGAVPVSANWTDGSGRPRTGALPVPPDAANAGCER